MSELVVRLFGKLEVERNGTMVDGLSARRAQELFAYLLLYQESPHTREAVADLLWPRSSAQQGMKYLRHAIWQLHSSLSCEILATNADWLHINPEVTLWIDVVAFQQAINIQRDIPGSQLDEKSVQAIDEAIALYRGEFFEGCYQEWCLIERERLQHLYLSMLDKQMAYCETNNLYEAAIDYGARALRCDMAHERIHRRLMRLHYLAGNRAAAVRQYQQCSRFLEEVLSVSPSARTVTLFKEIRDGRPLSEGRVHPNENGMTASRVAQLQHLLSEMKRLHTSLLETEGNLQKMIHAVEKGTVING